MYPCPWSSLEKEIFGACLMLDIQASPTSTLIWKKSNFQSKAVLIFVPGNPGVVEYYFSFLDNVYHSLRKEIDIFAVQHVNHCYHPHLDDKLFGLQDQINHKLWFLDHLCELYPKTTTFFLMGHSIGAFICLKLLNLRGSLLKQSQRLSKVFLLFPTLENIRSTPNGAWFQSVMYVPLQIPRIVSSFLWNLPSRLLLNLIPKVSPQQPWQTFLSSQLFHPSIMHNLMHMCRDEMHEVKDLDASLIKEYLPWLVFYYGKQDDWVPLSMWENMCQLFPQAEIYLCNANLPHAFVLLDNEIMSQHVVSWITTALAKQSPKLIDEAFISSLPELGVESI